MKFFKQHFESCNREWTTYGKFEDSDITPNGDFPCMVDCVEIDTDCGHIKRTIYPDYCERSDIELISEEEYIAVGNKLREVDKLYEQADAILTTLI